MADLKDEAGFLRRNRTALAFAAVLALGFALYAAGVGHNPPGFFVDESSVAYNAHTISQTGRDEFGNSWPLFFRAFGDYKNPVYVYLLAALFAATGPSILVARLLSVASGIAAAALLGTLGARLSGRREVGLLVAASALLTPWFFELSRVVLEVALYPAAVALFLLCLHRASLKANWSWREALCLAATLALLTYTYSIGRLLAPLFALGLFFFATRARARGILLTWGFYALSIVPMLVFQRRHPDALTGRFKLISYVAPESSAGDIAREFVKHYAANLNPWNLLVTGDPNVYQVAHVRGTSLMLAATALLAAVGAWMVLRRHGREAWWRFVFYGLAVSIIPASLTKENFHILRLAALPVFLVVLIVPALAWLRAANEGSGERGWRRVALAAVMFLTVLQGAVFQWQYHAGGRSPWRMHMFDAEYPDRIFAPAVAAPNRPVYLADALTTPYIQAYWYATLRGIPVADFVRLAPDESPPPGALVITTRETCVRCRILAESDPYKLYLAGAQPPREPLPPGGFRAEIAAVNPPAEMRAGERFVLHARVRNAGDATWLAHEQGSGQFAVNLANRWLDLEGHVVAGDDGRSAPLSDVRPGEETEMRLNVNAPQKAGDYILELDMVQEGVSWFGPKGSRATHLRVKVVE
ncbi:MAG TPA: glycosyltransferase family 39 protein [Pyrinomonadaceae bacterium]|nr:glycosyltransferase family 39 protein [Pyrinomonadaceae bacterium]